LKVRLSKLNEPKLLLHQLRKLETVNFLQASGVAGGGRQGY
jgi:hypothetical protein